MEICYQALRRSAVEMHEVGEVCWPGEGERVGAPEDGVRLAVDLTTGPKKVECGLREWFVGHASEDLFA